MIRSLLLLGVIVASSWAHSERVVELTRMPDEMAMPCHRPIPLQRLTSGVVPVLPGRGINLMFPRELELRDKENVAVTLSSDNLFQVKPLINDMGIIPIGFKKYTPDDEGEVRDLTIATEYFTVTLALMVDSDPRRHCTNIEFTLDATQKERIEAEQKKRYQAAIDAKFKERMEALDQEVNEKALLMVAGLASDRPEQWRIKEESELELPNGDEVLLYVRDIQKFGQFYVLSYEIENKSRAHSVYVTKADVLQGKLAIAGAMDVAKKVEPGEVFYGTFASQKLVPNTLASLRLETNQGLLEVKW